MSIRRGKHQTRFTVVPNETLDDLALSYEGLGLLVYLLGKPEDWRVRIADLTKRKRTGRDRCYKLIAELEEAGYIVRERLRGADGRVGETEYVVYDTPKIDARASDEAQDAASPHPDFQDMAPHPEKPDTEKPDTAFQGTYKEITSTKSGKGQRTETADAVQTDLLGEPEERKPKRKSQIPPGKPDEKDIAWARAFWKESGVTGIDVTMELARFRAHHESRGTLMVDWSAAWRTWVMNAVKFAKDRAPAPVQPSAALSDEERWRFRVRGFFEKGVWPAAWGDNPDSAGCPAPKSIVAEERKRRVAA